MYNHETPLPNIHLVTVEQSASAAISKPHESTQGVWSVAFCALVVYSVFEYARLTDGYPFLRALEPAKVTIGIALVGLLIFEPSRRVGAEAARILIANFSLLTIALVSGLFAAFGAPAWKALIGIINYTVLAFLIGKIVVTPRRMKIFVVLLVALVFKLSQHQIRYYQSIQAYGRDDEFLARGVGVGSSSFFGNSNDFGLAVATFFPIPLFLALGEQNKLLRIFYLLCALVIGAAIFLSGSRGSMLATFVVALAFLMQSRRKWLAISVVAGLLFAASFLLTDAHWERIQSAGHFEEDSNAQIRLTLWKAGMNMFLHHPVLGVGPGNFAPTYGREYAEKIKGAWAPHSIYIQSLAELGFFGFLALMTILVGTLRLVAGIRKRTMPEKKEPPSFLNRLATALGFALLAFMINGATITVLFYPHLWFIVGMSLGLAQIEKNANERPIRSGEAAASSGNEQAGI